MSAITCIGFLVAFVCDLPPPPPPVVVCPPVTIWSARRQGELADDIARLPPGSPLRRAMREHVQLRDRLRKCREPGGGASAK
jgi:hypothetical protein